MLFSLSLSLSHTHTHTHTHTQMHSHADTDICSVSCIASCLFTSSVFSFSDCTGNNFFWCWLLLCCHRMAYFGHDFGGIWIHCTLQVCRILTFMIVAVIFVITHFNCYWNIFCSGFWPTLAVFLQKIPILGWLFQQPYIRSVCLFWNLKFHFIAICLKF
jgi:hypothetical protein